jgi:TPR repeat protein
MKRVGGAFAFAAACGLALFAQAAFAQLGLTARLQAPSAPSSSSTSSYDRSPASAASTLTPEQAVRRYNLAESFERRHDLRSAFDAYSQAGEAGHPLAQKRLGDIYSTGNAAVPRDYAFTYPGTPSSSLR